MGKYLTERERYQIEGYRKIGLSVKEIAGLVGKCERTIYYELKRGKCLQRNSDYTENEVYLADVSQRKYEENKLNKGATLKIGNDLQYARHIETMILENKYSPYATLQDIENKNLQFKTKVCTTTIYNYIRKGIFLNLSEKDLPAPRKKKKEENTRKIALHNLKGTSIEQRPKEILERNNYGNWEMDTVVGSKNGKACLLVLTERKTREEIIRKIPNKKTESVIKALNKIEKEIGTIAFRNKFQTITCDNGVEFLNFKGIETGSRNKRKKRTIVYYCHPYSSWERGSNENANKLIRRFIPKGTNIENYTDEEILQIEKWINNYPRKIFKGLSSNMIKIRLGIIA